jgi:hypothetical protein
MSDHASSAAATSRFDAKARWHREQAKLPLKEKVRILLARRRPLEPWERPWPIQP